LSNYFKTVLHQNSYFYASLGSCK